MFECHLCLKRIEEDTWETGCLPETAQEFQLSIPIRGASIAEVTQQIAAFTGCTEDQLEIDAAEDPGRIDAQVLETDQVDPMSAAYRTRWRNGQIKGYLATYSFYFEQVTRVPAQFHPLNP